MLASTMCKALGAALSSALGAMLCLGMSKRVLPPGHHAKLCASLLPRPPCSPLDSPSCPRRATERPAKRLATPRATLTSSLRMSSQGDSWVELEQLVRVRATPAGREGRDGWWSVGCLPQVLWPQVDGSPAAQ